MKKNNNMLGIFTIVALILLIGIGVYSAISTRKYQNEVKDLRKQVTDLNNANANNTSESQSGQDQIEVPEEYDVSAFEKIKAQDIANISKGQKAVIIIAREDCGFCRLFVPVLTQVKKEMNIPVYYINFYDIEEVQLVNGEYQWVTIDQEAEDLLINMKTNSENTNFMKKNYGGTPLTIVVEDNTLIGGISGWIDSTEEVKNILTGYGVK